MSANDKQVGGSHYRAQVQHWDMVADHQLNYFEGQITKYVMRARKKNGKQDLEKAMHFLEKYLEVYDKLVPPKVDFILNLEDDIPKLGPVRAPEFHQNEQWQCEGFYGDMTQLYRCKRCRELYRTADLDSASQAHGDCAGPGYVSQE